MANIIFPDDTWYCAKHGSKSHRQDILLSTHRSAVILYRSEVEDRLQQSGSVRTHCALRIISACQKLTQTRGSTFIAPGRRRSLAKNCFFVARLHWAGFSTLRTRRPTVGGQNCLNLIAEATQAGVPSTVIETPSFERARGFSDRAVQLALGGGAGRPAIKGQNSEVVPAECRWGVRKSPPCTQSHAPVTATLAVSLQNHHTVIYRLLSRPNNQIKPSGFHVGE